MNIMSINIVKRSFTQSPKGHVTDFLFLQQKEINENCWQSGLWIIQRVTGAACLETGHH